MMNGENILPVATNNGWGNGMSAGFGGFIGSLFGSGGFGNWGGNWNRGGNDGGCGCNGTNLILDGINGVSNSVNNLNTSNLQGQCQLQAGVDRNAALVQNTLAQGFSGVNAAINNAGYETRLAINAQSAQQANCCCDLKQLIASEGCQTRQLMKDIQTQNIQDQLCQERSKNAQLETQAALAAQTAAIFNRYPVAVK